MSGRPIPPGAPCWGNACELLMCVGVRGRAWACVGVRTRRVRMRHASAIIHVSEIEPVVKAHHHDKLDGRRLSAAVIQAWNGPRCRAGRGRGRI